MHVNRLKFFATGRVSLLLHMARPVPPSTVPPAHLRGCGTAIAPKRGDQVIRILASLGVTERRLAPTAKKSAGLFAPTAKKSAGVAFQPSAVVIDDETDDDYEPTLVADSSVGYDDEVCTPPYEPGDGDDDDNIEYGDGDTVKTEIKDDESGDDGDGNVKTEVKDEESGEDGDGHGNTVKTDDEHGGYGYDNTVRTDDERGGYGNTKTEVKDDESGEDGYGNTKTEVKDESGEDGDGNIKTEIKDEYDDDDYNVKTEIKDEHGDGYGNDEDNDNDEYAKAMATAWTEVLDDEYGNTVRTDDEHGGYDNTVRTYDEHGGYGNDNNEYGGYGNTVRTDDHGGYGNDDEHGDGNTVRTDDEHGEADHYTAHMPWDATRKVELEVDLEELRQMPQQQLSDHFRALGYGKLKGIGHFYKPLQHLWAFRSSKKRGGGANRRQLQDQHAAHDRRMHQQSRSSTAVNPDLSNAPWRVGSN
jgi:hypothetical protein